MKVIASYLGVSPYYPYRLKKSLLNVDSTPKCNSQGPRALAVDGLRDQGER